MGMADEGGSRTAVAFVDGQNLFHAVRRCLGYALPSYEVLRLARTICASQG